MKTQSKKVTSTLTISNSNAFNLIDVGSNQSEESKLLNNLVRKEMISCAKHIDIDSDELQVWLKLQIDAPLKAVLILLRLARQYNLDPLKEEILLTRYEDRWQTSISIDGWIKLIHRHPSYAGITFRESIENNEGLPLWIECTIYRSDNAMPTTVREYLSEAINDTDIWRKMPRRMLRHKAMQQCARVAIGISPPELQNETPVAQDNNDSITNTPIKTSSKASEKIKNRSEFRTQTERLKQKLSQNQSTSI